ncbi:hypothetical protein DWUX_801 [Desulfovibrio diazotrophicus]|nr:hypothetical protein DWUX_801 [Desulfovibrio diazotrophicus]
MRIPILSGGGSFLALFPARCAIFISDPNSQVLQAGRQGATFCSYIRLTWLLPGCVCGFVALRRCRSIYAAFFKPEAPVIRCGPPGLL